MYGRKQTQHNTSETRKENTVSHLITTKQNQNHFVNTHNFDFCLYMLAIQTQLNLISFIFHWICYGNISTVCTQRSSFYIRFVLFVFAMVICFTIVVVAAAADAAVVVTVVGCWLLLR